MHAPDVKTGPQISTDLVSTLIGARSADGGWAALPPGSSDVESTAWAVLGVGRSGGDDSAANAAADGRAWLLRHQRPDGAWPVWPAVPQPGWTTALAVLALAEADGEDGADAGAASAATGGGHWLLDARARRTSWLVRTLTRLGWVRASVELDHSLSGWPWVPDTFSWVEPTSWSVLAIRALHGRLPDRRVRSRVEEGVALLLDRACVGGGWNYGNRTVLGENLWPYPDTTAIALLALATVPQHPTVRAGAAALDRMLGDPASRLSLALGALALRALGRDASSVQERLVAAWSEPDRPATTRATALSLLALSEPPWPAAPRERFNG